MQLNTYTFDNYFSEIFETKDYIECMFQLDVIQMMVKKIFFFGFCLNNNFIDDNTFILHSLILL